MIERPDREGEQHGSKNESQENRSGYLTLSPNKMFNANDYKDRDLSGYELLIVDDTPVNVILIQKMLSRFSFKLDVAYNGRSALEKINRSISSGKRFSMVLLDLRMPDISGFDVLRKLRETPAADGMPVVVLSGLTDNESLNEAASLGAVGYLSKPIIMNSLYSTVFRYLNIDVPTEQRVVI